MEDEILTIDEVAKYLKVSRSWIYQNYKTIGGIKLGNKTKGLIRFPSKEEIYDFLFHPDVPEAQKQINTISQKKRKKKSYTLKEKERIDFLKKTGQDPFDLLR